MEWPSTTIQYRLNLPSALYSISPALSALHASRAVALHPEVSTVLSPSHCPKCGTYRFSGDRPPKRKRRKRLTPSSLRCHLCGFSVDAVACNTSPHPPASNSSVPIQSSSNLPRTGTAATNETLQVSAPTDTLRPTPPASVPSSRDQQFHHRDKPYAKTSTLKDMLSRDRKREEGKRVHDKRKEGYEGLAAFLKQL